MRTGPPEKRRGGKIARWSVLLAANGALLFVVGISTIRESYREWKVDQDINQIQSQIERLEGKKLELTDLIKRMESDDTLDREARTRLGLRKPGERVIILRGADGEATSWQDSAFQAPLDQAAPPPQSNPERWLRYFFPINPEA